MKQSSEIWIAEFTTNWRWLALLSVGLIGCEQAQGLLEQGKEKVAQVQQPAPTAAPTVATPAVPPPASPASTTQPVPPDSEPVAPAAPASIPAPVDFAGLVRKFQSILPNEVEDQDLIDIAAIPPEFRSRVTKFNLQQSRITDRGLAELAKFPETTEINLAYCSGITSPGLAGIQSLLKLRILNLRATQLDSQSLRYLSKLTQLRWLSLMESKISDTGLEQLRALGSLKELYLQGLKLDGSGLEQLSAVNSLVKLDLSQNRPSERSLRALKQFRSLQTLALRECNLTDEMLVGLKGIPSIRELDLSLNPLGDRGVKHLAGNSRLEQLFLNETKITDKAGGTLKSFKKLQRFEARGTGFSQAGAAQLKKAFPEILIVWE